MKEKRISDGYYRNDSMKTMTQYDCANKKGAKNYGIF